MSRSRGHNFRGFTLLESLILLFVFSVVSVGVSVGLQSATDTAQADDHALAISAELISEAENWRAVDFGNSPWPASLPYSLTDTVTMSIGGTTYTFPRTTTIKLWDPTNIATDATPQTNFAQVQITINGQTLTVYMCNLI